MPEKRLREQKRADAYQEWWANFPYGSGGHRMEAIDKFQQEVGPLTEAEKRAALFRWSPEQKERIGISQQYVVPADIGEEAASDLVEEMLDERHYTILLNETGKVEKKPSDSAALCVLLKNRLPKELLDRVRPAIRAAASQSIASGNRPDAAGTGKAVRLRPDGSKTKISGVPALKDLNDEDYIRLKNARDGVVGYYEIGTRAGQPMPCRQTAFTSKAPIWQLSAMTELATAVALAWQKSFMSEQYEIQMAKVLKTRPEFVLETSQKIIPGISWATAESEEDLLPFTNRLPFTTITCNNRWRTAAHIDSGDFKQGFGVMCCLGDFDGCDLVFPRYKTAVRYREGDILLADVANEVHGNTPLLKPDGSVPKLGEEPERLVCVFYYRAKMEFCASPEEEMDVINNWKKGESSRAKKKKKS